MPVDVDRKRKRGREWARRNYAAQANAHRAKNANRAAARYGAPGLLTTTDVDAVLPADAVCMYCSGTHRRMTIDHRVPLALGGSNTRENIGPCCLPCNASKGRADRPGRWSWAHDACISCGTTERRHFGHGRCQRCYYLHATRQVR